MDNPNLFTGYHNLFFMRPASFSVEEGETERPRGKVIAGSQEKLDMESVLFDYQVSLNLKYIQTHNDRN